MTRSEIAPGEIIRMQNSGEYRLGPLLGQGRDSLIYSASTVGEGTHCVLKEFFPYGIARRGEDGITVEPRPGYRKKLEEARERFDNENRLGAQARAHCIRILNFSLCGDGWAVLPRHSSDMVSLGQLVERWKAAPPPSPDPVFTDLGRLAYSLQIINSLLAAVESIHKQGILHGDIHPENVFWAGQDMKTGSDCEAYLADFGRSDTLTEPKDCSADLHSIRQLLIFLLGDTGYRNGNKIGLHLRIPGRFTIPLLNLMYGSNSISAEKLRSEVLALRQDIPTETFNRINPTGFTLRSLKALLGGSLGQNTSWALELADRNNYHFAYWEEHTRYSSPVCYRTFANDRDFLQALLPQRLLSQLESTYSGGFGQEQLMDGVFPESWSNVLIRQMKSDEGLRLRQLQASCSQLVDDSAQLHIACQALFTLLPKETDLLKRCFRRCDAWEKASLALTLLTLFALFGQDGFSRLVENERQAAQLLNGR